MTIFGIHFHSFKYIEMEKTQCFLGEKYQDYQKTGLRICKECKVVQDYAYDSQGGVWFDLNQNQQRIIAPKIYTSKERFLINQNPYSKSWCKEVEPTI